ncbi:flagellar export pore protein [Sterolibacterium denitrificans]|uniref:Flagellar biosynthetic protein FlhB n=1 Tax=Sterolibacterium denitrificans TaxID=157592 RepID=A0A7Z7HSG1_9PROT|nr:flagellar biosynthesis protein FlhB [Sterolibacterium denitrificans]SMB29965.1 flagellar export pore protein [Sterolibacterium denitrificans]
MAEDSDLERTEPASSRRLEQAREDGRVPHSRELSAFLVLLAGVSALWTMGGWFAQHAKQLMRRGLSFGHDQAFDPYALANAFLSLSMEAMTLLAPLFLVAVLGALAGPLMLGGVVFSSKALAPDFNRINPLSGLKRIFSVQGIAELVKSVLKALLVGGVVYWVVVHQQDALFALLTQPLERGLVSFGDILLFAMLALVSGVALVSAIDVPFQLWQYHSKLRMTKEEVRQENKEQEGDPQVKGRIRSQQREMARRRMMADVPKADVVVTNPTHFAVALKYDSGQMGAPQVLAKGINLVAQNIRELAAKHDVPLLEAPPLARALYRHCDIGEQIPAALYGAVAEVMAYVYQLQQYLAGQTPSSLPPQAPQALPVPAELDPGQPVVEGMGA